MSNYTIAQMEAVTNFVWLCRIECTLSSPMATGYKITDRVFEYATTLDLTQPQLSVLRDRLERDSK